MNQKNPQQNRLIHQKSPYLLQHATNPVDWYPWGEEAFNKAKELDKPIFLSIGYATCHWCHVMEKECFQDPQIAQMLNETFINIKVDREELPEVDGLYMDFAQTMMAGAAGWPLNVILTPELQPFFAATYLPPVTSHGLIGLNDLIARIREVWLTEEREKIDQQAAQIVEVFKQTIHTKGEDVPEQHYIKQAAELLFQLADPINGGLKGEPKFPIGYQANFLLDYLKTSDDGRAVFLVDKTLEMMYRGGIYDHLGGGFSRYSVDEKWVIPHFEKMLYDNALLIGGYLAAWQVTKRDLYKNIIGETIDYVLRDMTHTKGGFYSAEDADTQGKEGRFYTWTIEEVQKVLGADKSIDFINYYDLTKMGNFEGRNVLHTPLSVEEYAQAKGVGSTKVLKKKLEDQKQALFEAREERPHPLKDDKILSAPNGLMIASLAAAGATLNQQTYLDAAVRAAKFIKSHMYRDRRLLRRWREGEAMYSAGLDDYAYMIKGTLNLFEAGCGTEWLEWAITLAKILDEQFKEIDGAYYQTDGSDPNILIRKCVYTDGAEPSGNAIQCENLLRLYAFTHDRKNLENAEDVLKAVKNFFEAYPIGYSYHIMNLSRYYDKEAPLMIVAATSKNKEYQEFINLAHEKYVPHRNIIPFVEDDKKILNLLPWLSSYKTTNGETTFYICSEGSCKQSFRDKKQVKTYLESL